MNDMYTKKEGMVFQSLRLQKNFSQKELATLSGLSVKTIERIENGESTLSGYVLATALPHLGVTRAEFYSMVDGNDMGSHDMPISFKNDFYEIWQLCFKDEFEEARQHLEVLKSKDYCNTDNPKIAQAILICESLLEADLYKNYHHCLNTLYEALRIAIPSIISQENEINYKLMSQHTYELNEYRILNLIATSLAKTNRRVLAIRILNAICNSLNNEKIDSEIRRTFLPTAYYNLSNAQIDEQRYKQAHVTCNKGVEFCNRVNNHKYFAFLLYNRGKSLLYMGNKDEVAKDFKHSRDTFIAHEDPKSAEIVRKTVAEKYQIYL